MKTLSVIAVTSLLGAHVWAQAARTPRDSVQALRRSPGARPRPDRVLPGRDAALTRAAVVVGLWLMAPLTVDTAQDPKSARSVLYRNLGNGAGMKEGS